MALQGLWSISRLKIQALIDTWTDYRPISQSFTSNTNMNAIRPLIQCMTWNTHPLNQNSHE